MLKKTVLIICVFALFADALSFPSFAFKEKLSVSAGSCVVMNAVSRQVLYSENAYEKRGMASTTKLMTSLLLLEGCELSTVVTAQKEDVMIEGTAVGLKPGEKLTAEDLLYAMLLESGNDAANVSASFLGKSRENFVRLMNKKAKALGMNDTHFMNPSGLPDSEHYSTAYDMSLLASVCILNNRFRNICSTQKSVRTYGEPSVSHYFTNHNRLLREYDGCIGMKTGFTKASGRCLVSAAERNGIILVAVTLNAPNDWDDHKKLLDYGFKVEKSGKTDIDVSGVTVPVTGGNRGSISVYCKEAYLPFSTFSEYKIFVERFLYAPVKTGEKAGKIVYYNENGTKIFSVDLLSANNVKYKNNVKKSKFKSFFEYIKDMF